MSRLEEDGWWMNLLKENPAERYSEEDLFGYGHIDSWWLDIGHGNLPKITSEPCEASEPCADQWWMTTEFGKDKSAKGAESATTRLVDNNATSNNLFESSQVASDLAVSAGAASAYNNLTVSPGAASASNDMTVRAGAASGSNSEVAFSRLKPSVNTSTMLEMMYAKVDTANPSGRQLIRYTDSLKRIKKCKKISIGNPERHLKQNSVTDSVSY